MSRAITTPTALQRLAALDLEAKQHKHSGVPAAYVPKTKFEDRTANGLTRCVTRWIELHGGYAPRIQSQGQYNEQLGRWTKGTTRKGTADVHAVYHSQHLSIEIKIGRDRQSIDQKNTAQMVERAGGCYYIAKTFEAFAAWFTDRYPHAELAHLTTHKNGPDACQHRPANSLNL